MSKRALMRTMHTLSRSLSLSLGLPCPALRSPAATGFVLSAPETAETFSAMIEAYDVAGEHDKAVQLHAGRARRAGPGGAGLVRLGRVQRTSE